MIASILRPARPLVLLVAALAGTLAARPADAQVAPGDVAVVTTDGFFLLRGATPQAPPALVAPAGQFGLLALAAPGVAWVPGSDAFVVSSGSFVFLAAVTPGGLAVTDITPAGGGVFAHPDLHPGTGELLLLDTQGSRALRFLPPFAPGMTAHATVQLTAAVRGLAHDSRSVPPGVTWSTSTQIRRAGFDGSDHVIAQTGAFALDDVPQIKTQTVYVRPNGHVVGRTTGSASLVQDLNIVGGNPFTSCSPVVLGPRSVVFDVNTFRILVLAEGGVNPACLPGIAGPNHVVALPPAIGAPPLVLTAPADSGITGTHGELARVHGDFPFVAPWGTGCGAVPLLLDVAGTATPVSPHAGFALQVRQAPPGAAVWMLAGIDTLSLSLPSGCTVLVQNAWPPTLAGHADGLGRLDLAAPVPPGVPAGTVLALQPVVTGPSGLQTGNGLSLHIAP